MTEPGPGQQGPAPSGPGRPWPARPEPTQPGPIQPGPIQPGPIQPGPIQPGPARSEPAQTGPAQSGSARPGAGPPGPGGHPVPPGATPYGDAGTPRRLSPRVLLIDPIRMLPGLLLPLAGVLVAGGFSPASFGWAALGVAGSVVYAVVRWATFTYRVTGDRLELTRALISRSVRTIPLERVRGIDITTPPLHRLLRLAVLKLDTGAGGDEQEGELDALTLEEAENLRAVLLARRAVTPFHRPEGSPAATEVTAPDGAAHGGTPDGVARGAAGQASGQASGAVPGRASEHHDERVVGRVPRSWLRYGPLSGAYLLTPFALLAGAVGLAFQVSGELRVDARTARAAFAWVEAHPALLVAAAVLLILAMPVAGGVMYAVFNWDFTLRTRDGYLVAERGLVTRRTVSLERRRIRGYELVDGLIERRFNVVRLWAVVTGLGDSETRGQLLPVAPRTFATAVASDAVGPLSAPLRPHPPQARRRRLFRAIAPWLAVAAAAGLLGWEVAALAALVLALLGIPLGLDRYRSLGHAYDGTRLSVRSGSLRRAQAVVERRAVVGWTLRQTVFQRTSGVLTVVAGVGAGTGGYPAIDTGQEQGVEFAAEVTPDWIRPFLAPQAQAGAADTQ
ncbi:PH domain-containing protein [Planotetraspora phitsanulokensis]|uniref:Membrane protein n=1 Tax=Planotetraspora phitsanulokensis TaxID=575192 RepID=A0A8J3U5B9_9ACTN|nr:PH domain-containing protein [Planotetraspora phitsanulokensis]GII38312.1 membrane protein [Planotetraspora phitsanulokensis]